MLDNKTIIMLATDQNSELFLSFLVIPHNYFPQETEMYLLAHARVV